MIAFIYTASDAVMAQRIQADLEKLGYTFTAPQADTRLLIVLYSPDALKDAQIQQHVFDALDNQIHILPVIVKPVQLPSMISNLDAADFTEEYRLNSLRKQIDYLLSPDVRPPMRVLTPAQRARNRRIGLIVALPAVIVFIAAIYSIAVLGLQEPTSEFEAVETARVELRNQIIDPTLEFFLPDNEDEAAVFEQTVPAVPTRLRPFLIETATALAATAQAGDGASTTPEPTLSD